MKRNYLPGPRLQLEGIVSLERGGTSADNVADARTNLNIVPQNRVGQALGLIPLDQFGKFSPSYLEGFVFSTVDLDGPSELYTSEAGVYKITNLDSRVNYTVYAELGTVSIDGDTVTYIAPDSHIEGGGFSINSSYYDIKILGPIKIPNTPVVVTPATDIISNTDQVLFVGSEWSSDYPEDSLAQVEWQYSTLPDFSVNLPGTIRVVNQGLTSALSEIPPDILIFARVRYKGYYGYFSEWSPIRSFTRPAEQKPETPAIVIPGADGVTHDPITRFVASNFQGTAPSDTAAEVLWQVAANADFTQFIQEFRKTDSDMNELELDTLRDRSYFVRMRYKGTSEWESDWSNVRIISYVPIEPAQRPTILSPGVNTTVTIPSVTLTASLFQAAAAGDAFQRAEWQVSRFGDFSVLFATANKEEAGYETYTQNQMTPGDTFYFRVRYMGVTGWYSEWSLVRAVTYGTVVRPTILSPASGTERLKPNITFYSSEFSLVGLSGTHVSTDWQMSESSGFQTLTHFLSESTSNRTFWTLNDLSYGKTYYVRVRYRSNGNIVSDWSPVTTIKTRAEAWSPLKTADIETTVLNGSVSVSNLGDLLAAGNRVYRISEAGPTLLRVFNNQELFGNAEQYLTASTQYGYASLVVQTGSTVEVIASAFIPDAVGATPKSLLAYAKYGYSNNQLVRTEHYVTGNPLVELSNDPDFEAVTPVHNFKVVGVQALGNNHTRVFRVRSATNGTGIYTVRLEKKLGSSFIPVPSVDTYALVQYPEVNGQMFTVELQAVAGDHPERQYTPNGYLMNENTGTSIQYFHETATQPTVTKAVEVAEAISNINVTGSWMNADMSVLYSLQGTRLLIFNNS